MLLLLPRERAGRVLEKVPLPVNPLPVNTPPLPEGAGEKRWNVNVMVTLILDDHPFKIGLKDPPPDICDNKFSPCLQLIFRDNGKRFTLLKKVIIFNLFGTVPLRFIVTWLSI